MKENWNSSTEYELLRKYVGDTYPDFDSAAKAKQQTADRIKEYLTLNKETCVMDLGPGAGFIASYLVNEVKHLHCVDVSESFLDKCKEVLRQDNVSFDLIKHGDLSKFKNIDSIYCMAVMIHFNIYDVAIYLYEMYAILPKNGKVLFDFYDADYFDLNDPVFQRHIQRYKNDRTSIVTNINFNSKKAVVNICKNLGFFVEILEEGKQPWVVLTKK